jgi:tetratricopeptide (TPR) repeat protein
MRNFLQRFRARAILNEEAPEPSLSGLGLPLEHVETDQQRARYGSYGKMVIALAWEQFNEGKLDDAINNTTVLIEDTNLQRNPLYSLILGAAHYVRGLAYVQKADFNRARSNFQAALKLVPDYDLARRALARVQRS